MNPYSDTIIYFLRMFISNMCVYYCFEKITNNTENRLRNNVILIVANLILLPIYVLIKTKFDTFLLFILLYLIYTVIISKLTKTNLGHCWIITIMSYAIFVVCHTMSVIIQFLPYKILEQFYNFDNMYVSLAIITLVLVLLLYGFFKIKRFSKGLCFLNEKLSNDIIDIVVINISAVVIIVYCLFENYSEELNKNPFLAICIVGIIMIFTIQKMLTMYYKQKLLTDTMEEYKQELVEKQNEIDSLKNDKKNVSKITHEFYNRQKALELLVASNMNAENIDKENVSPNVLKIIESLTDEYSQRFESMKELPKLDMTDIPEIDNMFKYMQSECDKNSINFKLKIMGNIHSLVNNIIPKNKLETLIGDHLRDAINAVNLSDLENREILAILGVKDKKYELSIFDTGVDFEIDTLVRLGLEAVTTNKDRGGTGTGFMTTFETMQDPKASLIITEYPIDNERQYAKCVTIRFDGKNQYRICSYRADKIKKISTDNRIKIEEYIKD